MTTREDLRAAVACSFCLKPTSDVESMVAGPGVFICDGCVSLCVEIIASKPETISAVLRWEQDLTDQGLLDHLPKIAALEAQVERQLTGWVRPRAYARDHVGQDRRRPGHDTPACLGAVLWRGVASSI